MKKYNKLRGIIIEKFGSISNFSDKMTITRVSLSRKLSGKSPFTSNDISEMCKLLEINETEIAKYFF